MSNPQSLTIELRNAKGLHARAAAKFVKTCEMYKAEVEVSKGGLTVSALSIMGLMMLGARFGSHIDITAAGPEAGQALKAIEHLINQRFGEG